MVDGPDHHLRNQVKNVENLVVQVRQEIGHVGSEVSAVSTAQRQTHSDLAQLRADFLAFTQASERRAAIQRAETRIGSLQDQLEHTYGHHKVVRRTAVGLLQAFDVGLVSEEAVRSISEQLMIQTPRYWLAPALVALSAWSADEPELCERAIAEAYRRSPAKTALLFTLVLRRQERLDGSARWLRHYLQSQDPAALGRDFAVILEAVAQGAFGPAGRAAVDDTLASWSEALDNPDSQAAQVARWRVEVEAHAAPPARDFPALNAVSPQWPQLSTALSGAEGHQPLLDKYRALMAEEMRTQERIEDAMDDILDRLVTEYDNEELPLQRELAYNKAVVDRDGDLDAAKTAAANIAAVFEETLDYLTIQTFSALDPASIGVSRATQKIAVASCRPWFEKAHDEATSAYRQQLPADVGVQFSGSHNIGAQTFQLPDWQGQLSTGLPQLEQSLGQHWDRNTADYVDSLAFPVQRKVVAPAIVTLFVAIVSFAINPIAGLLITLAVAGIWGLRLYQQYEQSIKAQAQARELLANWKQESLTQLRAAGAELTDWGSRFSAADGKAEEARSFIASLDTAGHGATTYETRTIHTGAHAAGAQA
jgi:hypothetical protein